MAHREFDDARGVHWQVWEVIPSSAERREGADRRADQRPRPGRRTQQELRIRLEEGLAHGWLAFESEHEKRRLHPIPDGWAERSGTELAELLEEAVVAPHSARKLLE